MDPLKIDRTFDRFMDAAYPAGVCAHQYDESRKVWYAAMHALLCHISRFQDVEERHAELERLFAETVAFGQLQSPAKD